MFLVAFYKSFLWRFQKHTVSHLSFFLPSSVFAHYINICGQNLPNPVLVSISTDHLNQVGNRRHVTPGAGFWLRTVKSIDHMSSVTSRCLEQFEWSTCDIRFPRHSLK